MLGNILVQWIAYETLSLRRKAGKIRSRPTVTILVMHPYHLKVEAQNKGRTNWEEVETLHLLSAVKEVQLRRGRVDLSFTSTEYGEMLRIFTRFMGRTERQQKQLKNRIKTLRQTYNVLKDLAGLSGWSWNYDDQEIRPPSEEILQEILTSDEEKYKWFTRRFCFFTIMEEVCNPGRGPRGAGQDFTFTQASQMPHTPAHSGSGSSDDPNDGRTDLNEGETVQQPSQRGRMSSMAEGQSSDGRRTTSGGSSGNKRKSTKYIEEGGRGKGSRLKPREQMLHNLVGIGNTLAGKYDQISSNSYNLTRKKEMQACRQKMKDLNIEGATLNFCIKEFNNDFAREFFLGSSEEDINRWFNSNNVPVDSPQSQPSASRGTPFNQNPQASYNPQPPYHPYNLYQGSNPQFFSDFMRMNEPNETGPMHGFRPDRPPDRRPQ